MKVVKARELFTNDELKEFGYKPDMKIEIIHECYFDETWGVYK